jgi:hypothetical protein
MQQPPLLLLVSGLLQSALRLSMHAVAVMLQWLLRQCTCHAAGHIEQQDENAPHFLWH